MNPDKKQDDRKPWGNIARYSEIGFIIPSAACLGLIFGKFLDYWLHSHWIYIAGTCLGAVVGFADMIRVAISSTHEK